MKRTPQKEFNKILTNLIKSYEQKLSKDKVSVSYDLYNVLKTDGSVGKVEATFNSLTQEEIYEQIDKIQHELKYRHYRNVNDFIDTLNLNLLKGCDKPTFSQHMDAVCTGVGNVDALKDILPPEQIAEMLKKNDGGDD